MKNIKWLLNFTVFFLVSSVLANENYTYHYIDKNIEISSNNFRRYAQPQLRSLAKEFFFSMVKVQPDQERNIDTMEKVLQLQKDWAKWDQECQAFKSECQEMVKDLYENAIQLDKQLLSLQKDHEHIMFKDKKVAKGLNTVSLFYVIGKLSNLSYQLLHLIEETAITYQTPYSLYSTARQKIRPLLHKIILSTENLIVVQLNQTYRQDFALVWNNFIKPIEKFILANNSRDYLLRNLEPLNTSWNSFRMKMTKTNISLPRKSKQVIEIMHNRWNAVLKIILRK